MKATKCSVLWVLSGAVLAPSTATALTRTEVDAMLETIDDRQRNAGDYKALAYIEQKERGKNDLLYQSVFYRRDADDKLVILFLKPKSESGKGYLRLEKNLFMYDPNVGKWERRTERERIMGTDSQRADFDASRLAEEYRGDFVAEEKLGRFRVHHLKLTAKKGVDVAYPTLHLWVDRATQNVLKREEYALSGRKMRTTYYPKWRKIFSPDKGANVYFPEEIRIYDAIEKGNQTTVVITKVDLEPLDPNVFTKAWLESKSR